MAAGLAIAALGFGVMSRVDGAGDLALVVIGSLVFSLGLAPVFTLTTDLIVGSAPPERAGAASAISETGAELGGALGIAILGSIGTAVYRNEVSDTVPAGVPPAEAETARDTLGGAVAAAERLTDPLGAALLDAAREAFVQGMQVTAVIAAVGAALTAVLAAVLLRNARGGPGSEPDAESDVADADASAPAPEMARAA
jgi:DHA2 family multidrug resistance protein-like MFS transporter